MLLMGIYACSESKTTPEAKDAVSKPSVASTKTRLPNEISDTVAIARKAAWQAKRAQLIALLKANNMAGDSVYILRGFAVPTQDFKDVAAVATPTPQDATTYSMMGINNGTQDIIFQIKDATGKERYFDFTVPCPENCPPRG
jgi:hypothetical protein